MIDGETPYLDGESLLPYIANPNLTSERAVVTGLRSKTVDCNCFPQWSVRTDQFHYIYYTSIMKILPHRDVRKVRIP